MRFVLCLAFYCFCVLAPAGISGARAGAFLQKEDDILVISSSNFSGSTRYFDAKGKLVPVGYYRKFELGTYIEYGVADWITLILQPISARIYNEGPPWGIYSGLSAIEAGARFKLGEYQSVVFSAQALAHFSMTPNRLNPALVGNTGHELDLRLLAGIPFEIEGFTGFADAQLGYRLRRDGPPNEFRADFTLGFRPFDTVLLLAQSFNIIAPSAGAPGFPRMRQHKVQASAVWNALSRTSFQVGVFTTLAARNARYERGIVTGVWYRF